MREYLELGCAPCDEVCVQVGELDYDRKSGIECRQFIQAIRKKCGTEPEGAQLAVKSFPHDFGAYKEIICYYSETQIAIEYAFKCESESPKTWKEVEMEKPNYDKSFD